MENFYIHTQPSINKHINKTKINLLIALVIGLNATVFAAGEIDCGTQGAICNLYPAPNCYNATPTLPELANKQKVCPPRTDLVLPEGKCGMKIISRIPTPCGPTATLLSTCE
jgi:hypothetical protein